MISSSALGSATAIGGFLNEKVICAKFNAWNTDPEAQEWLRVMNYDLSHIESIDAIQVPVRISRGNAHFFGITQSEYDEVVKYKKADAQIRLVIKLGNITRVENISIKKSNSSANFNQVDKRPVDRYQDMWAFDDNISMWLKGFTGALPPTHFTRFGVVDTRASNRLFLEEMPPKVIENIISFFSANKILVVADILKGRGSLSAGWFLVTRTNVDGSSSWVLKDINLVLNHFGNGDVTVSPRGSLHIGSITMQRKGGTPDPTSLQFKINPLSLFA